MTERDTRARGLLLMSGLLVAVGCGGPSARIRGRDEASLVGDRRAGAAVYYNIIDGALKKLSDAYRRQTSDQATFRKIRMSYLGVDNMTTEELGSWRDHINQIIVERINHAADFMDISYRRFLLPAMREAGVNKDQLTIPNKSRLVTAVLEKQGSPIDYALFASITQGNTRAAQLKQSDYNLVLELVNLTDGTSLTVSEMISKEYSR